jgi:hypothetical protein
MRRQGELLERPNAYLHDTGVMRRTYLRRQGNILNRLLVYGRAETLACGCLR